MTTQLQNHQNPAFYQCMILCLNTGENFSVNVTARRMYSSAHIQALP